MLISVVIPAYNVESCINRSVSSVLNQSFDDLEVIIIDDGSNDRTPSICDKLAKKDKRVKVLHQKNSGVSEARNVRISHSLGNYIFFLDADDWLDLNYFKIVSKELKEGYYSLVCNSYKVVSKLNSNNDMCSYAESKRYNLLVSSPFLFSVIGGVVNSMAPGNFIRHSVIEKTGELNVFGALKSSVYSILDYFVYSNSISVLLFCGLIFIAIYKNESITINLKRLLFFVSFAFVSIIFVAFPVLLGYSSNSINNVPRVVYTLGLAINIYVALSTVALACYLKKHHERDLVCSVHQGYMKA